MNGKAERSIAPWSEKDRNEKRARASWEFTTDEADVKNAEPLQAISMTQAHQRSFDHCLKLGVAGHVHGQISVETGCRRW